MWITTKFAHGMHLVGSVEGSYEANVPVRVTRLFKWPRLVLLLRRLSTQAHERTSADWSAT